MAELTKNEFERFHNHIKIVVRCDLDNIFNFPEFLQGLTIIAGNSKFSYSFSNYISISISNFPNNFVKQHWAIRQGRNNRRGPERQNELLQVTEYNTHLFCQAFYVCVYVCVHKCMELGKQRYIFLFWCLLSSSSYPMSEICLFHLFYKYLFIKDSCIYFLAVMGLHCCMWAFLQLQQDRGC